MGYCAIALNRSFAYFSCLPSSSLFPQNNTITELSQYLECFIYSFSRAHKQKQRNKTKQVNKKKNTILTVIKSEADLSKW